jgi:hypothetical protein
MTSPPESAYALWLVKPHRNLHAISVTKDNKKKKGLHQVNKGFNYRVTLEASLEYTEIVLKCLE